MFQHPWALTQDTTVNWLNLIVTDSVTMVSQEEEQRRLKEEQERKEHEEYLKLKKSFVVEEEGEIAEQEDEEVSGYVNCEYFIVKIFSDSLACAKIKCMKIHVQC